MRTGDNGCDDGAIDLTDVCPERPEILIGISILDERLSLDIAARHQCLSVNCWSGVELMIFAIAIPNHKTRRS